MAMQHYEGKLGIFDYDDFLFRIDLYKHGSYLHYIGTETDGRKIKVPDGLTSSANMFAGNQNIKYGAKIPDSVIDVSRMYAGCRSLEEVPDFPNNVKKYDDVFDGCSLWVRVAGIWNLEHPGQKYPEPTAYNKGVLFGFVMMSRQYLGKDFPIEKFADAMKPMLQEKTKQKQSASQKTLQDYKRIQHISKQDLMKSMQ